MTEIVWISLNPKSCNIEIYPMEIALKLEDAYWTFQRSCELGKNFNNSVVHFYFGIIYQITPKRKNLENDDLVDYEEHKSVQRCIVRNKKIAINVKKNEGEWRITLNESDKIKTMHLFIQAKDIIEVNTKP